MGQKVKLTSDPDLAEPHAAGAKMVIVQPCIHDVYGALFVHQVAHVKIHFNRAAQRRDQLKALDDQIQALDVGDWGRSPIYRGHQDGACLNRGRAYPPRTTFRR